MKKKIFKVALILLALIVVGLAVFFGYRMLQNKLSAKVTKENTELQKVIIRSKTLELEISKNLYQKRLGLMYRKQIPENGGMIFYFVEDGIYTFWMKNTTIPLDMIWINNENKIVYIKKDAKPCEVDPCEEFTNDVPGRYVLEVNSGWVDKNGIQIGDAVEFVKN